MDTFRTHLGLLLLRAGRWVIPRHTAEGKLLIKFVTHILQTLDKEVA